MSNSPAVLDAVNYNNYDYSTVYKSPKGIAVYEEWYNKRLQRLGVAYQSLRVPTHFGEAHVIVAGPTNGLPLFLIHSSLDDVVEWEQQINYFSQYRRVYAVDVIGHSARSVPVHLSSTNSDYAIWLLDVLEGLKLEKADFAGVYGSCGIILKLASYAPSRVNSAIFISPHGVVPLKTGSILKFIYSIGAVIFHNPWFIRRLIYTQCAGKNSLSEPVIQEQIAQFQMIVRYLKYPPFFPTFSDEQLSKLTMPTLVLMGQQSQVYKTADAENRLRRMLPKVLVQYIPAAGHMLLQEKPDAVNFFMAQHLNYVAASYATLPATV